MAVNANLEKSLMVPAYPIWRLSVEQYHKMINVGILNDDDAVELLEGWLVAKMPQKPQHSFITQRSRDVLSPLLPDGWTINVQAPITALYSEPEPDISIVRGKREGYSEHHPYPEDIALILEVSDTTLQRDRTLKLRIYASARIAVYWILNLQDRQLEIYTDPHGTNEQAEYRQQIILHETDNVPLIIDGQEVARLAVRELLA
jgi:hypothetical protein